MDKLRLQIISPKRVVFDGECTMLEYTTSEGQVGVLPGHIAMTQVIAPGILAVYEDGVENPMKAAIHAGIAKVMPDLVMVLTETIELKEEIDVERAKKALDRANKRISEKASNLDLDRARLARRRAETRLSLAALEN